MTDDIDIYYQTYLRSDEWLERAALMRRWTAGTCEVCESSDDLQVHHLHYRTLGRETPRALIVLCDYHHRQAHIRRVTPGKGLYGQLQARAREHPSSFKKLERELAEEARGRGTRSWDTEYAWKLFDLRAARRTG